MGESLEFGAREPGPGLVWPPTGCGTLASLRFPRHPLYTGYLVGRLDTTAWLLCRGLCPLTWSQPHPSSWGTSPFRHSHHQAAGLSASCRRLPRLPICTPCPARPGPPGWLRAWSHGISLPFPPLSAGASFPLQRACFFLVYQALGKAGASQAPSRAPLGGRQRSRQSLSVSSPRRLSQALPPPFPSSSSLGPGPRSPGPLLAWRWRTESPGPQDLLFIGWKPAGSLGGTGVPCLTLEGRELRPGEACPGEPTPSSSSGSLPISLQRAPPGLPRRTGGRAGGLRSESPAMHPSCHSLVGQVT